jgi:hypothetical protein
MHAAPQPHTARPTRGARNAAALSAALAATLWTCQPLRAADSLCDDARIQITAEQPERWRQSLQEMCDRLATTPDVDSSARLEIVATDSEAQVMVTLADGRRAIRHVHSPENLFATVEALVVTPLSEPVVPARTPEQPVFAPAPAGAQLVAPPQPLAAPVPNNGPTLEFGGSLVSRFARAPSYVAGGFSLLAGVRMSDWLLGVTVRWDLLETLLPRAPIGFEMDSVGAGFLLARRVLETRALALQLGGTAQLLADTQSIEKNEAETDRTAVDLQLGMLGQLLFGRPPLRWSISLEAELSPARLRHGVKLYEPLPSYSLGLGFGAAWELR